MLQPTSSAEMVTTGQMYSQKFETQTHNFHKVEN